MLRNETSGNGYVFTNFGIGILTPASENLVADNIVTGNLTGVRVGAGARSNIIRGNVIAGNPPILVSNSMAESAPLSYDILNLAPAGANTFENNTCITSMNAPCANLRSEADVLPVVKGVGSDLRSVRRGGSVTVTFSGNNLTNTTYFDVRFRAPGASADDVAFNWQQGASAGQKRVTIPWSCSHPGLTFHYWIKAFGGSGTPPSTVRQVQGEPAEQSAVRVVELNRRFQTVHRQRRT